MDIVVLTTVLRSSRHWKPPLNGYAIHTHIVAVRWEAAVGGMVQSRAGGPHYCMREDSKRLLSLMC